MANTTAQEIQILYTANTTKSIGGITIDAFIQETYDHTASVTELPIQDGAKIGDHLVQEPDQLSIDGFVGDTDLYADYQTEKPPVNRAGEYYEKLLVLKEAGELITVVTGLRAWSNMVITSLSVPRSSDSGKSLSFSMTLKKVTIIKSTEIQLTKVGGSSTSKTTRQQTQSKVKVGKTSTNTIPADKKRDSILAQCRKN
jgi:hypothetical protein